MHEMSQIVTPVTCRRYMYTTTGSNQHSTVLCACVGLHVVACLLVRAALIGQMVEPKTGVAARTKYVSAVNKSDKSQPS